jgi:hypothetical protein
MPGTLLASLQLGRVARSSQQMPAIGPFADALEARCDRLLLAGFTPTRRSAFHWRRGTTPNPCPIAGRQR